nr:phosphoribosylglycinamide synthetase C domain-containing protein [Exilispira sp.]
YEIAGYKDFIGEKSKNNLSKIFFAGVDYKDNKLVTNRGRVLNIVSRGKTLEEARKNVYQDIEKIKFDNLYYRKDI